MNYEIMIISIFASLAVIVTAMLFLFLRTYQHKTNLNLENQQIQLEMFRESLEKNLYATSDKLLANEDRWKDLNHMLLETSGRLYSPKEQPKNLFLDLLSIDRSKIEINTDNAFLLAPINNRFQRETQIIKEACYSLGMGCVTADEKYISGPILSMIVEKILSSAVVLALLDGRNPNVFYELGLAHAFGKQVVMITSGPREIPFDIQSQRMVIVNWDDFETEEIIRRAVAESLRWNIELKR